MQRQRWGIAPAISFDEMWTYQRARRGKKRQEVWIWTAAIELPDGRRCVDFEVGDRSGETFLRLYERLPEAERYYSDDYGVYGSWLPAERHIVGKGKLANRNEGLHSEYRGRLKRLARATTGYAKQVWVLRGSLALLCLRPWPRQKSEIGAGDHGLHEAGVGDAWFAGVVVFASVAAPKIRCQLVLKIPSASAR